MGCCQAKAHEREFPHSEGSFSINEKRPDKWMERTVEKEYSKVEKLIQFRNEEDVEGIAQHFSDLAELNGEEVKLREEGEIMPETVACLGIAFLTELTLQNSGKTATCVAKESGVLVEHIRSGSDDLKYWTLGLLSSALMEGTKELESIKAALLENDIFSVLLPLLEYPAMSIQKRAIQVSAKIYRKCPKGQEAFFNKGGASHLIKLLKNVKNSETEATPLMEHLSGLLLVTYS